MSKDLSRHFRDRTALIIGGSLVALILLAGVIVTAGTLFGRLDRTIATRSAALRDLGRLRGEARLLQQQIRGAEEKLARTRGESLVPVVEGLANRIAGQGNLAYLRPLASSVQDGLTAETLELKLERQSLEQALRLLWEVENHPAAPMHIQGMRLQRRFENHALLDVTLTINAYRK
jgi:hypothetical protein